jgi:regulator of sigma E protease
VQLIGESAQVGLIYLINLTALISINLGLLNLLPIPALDGSKLIFLGIEAVRGKPVDPKKENFVHLIGFALLMTLMLFVTYRDIVRLFK